MVTASMVKPTVEVAFTGTDASPTWTDITHYVRDVSTDRGRNREVDQFDAGTCAFQLLNSDRRFDPEYASTPYGQANLIPGKPIRIRATYNSITYDLYRGYIDRFPQTYSAPRVAWVDCTATDAFKRLERIPFHLSSYAGIISSQAPDNWYRLGEPNEATLAGIVAVDHAGGEDAWHHFWGGNPTTRGAASLIVGDDDTATTIAHSNSERVLIGNRDFLDDYPFTLSCVIKRPTAPADFGTIFAGARGTDLTKPYFLWGISTSSPGAVVAGAWDGVGGSFAVVSTATVDDNQPHHVAVVCASSSSFKLYIDGVEDWGGGGTATAMPTRSPNGWAIGNFPKLSQSDFGLGGTIDEFAVWRRALTGTEIALQSAARMGYDQELSGTRVLRLLVEAGWPTAMASIEAGATPLRIQNMGDVTTLLEAVRTIDATERGGLYVDTNGKVSFRSRHAHFKDSRSLVSNATFGDGPGELDYKADSLQFDFDDDYLRNWVTAQREDGAEQVVVDAASITKYGVGGFSRSGTQEGSDALARNGAEFDVTNYKDIQTRIESISIAPQRDPVNLWPQALGRQIGDRITVNRRPQGVGSVISKELLIEAISHDVTPEEWTTTFKVSPVLGEQDKAAATPIYGYLILNDTTRGKLDNNRVGF